MPRLKIYAPSKLNLLLDITGRREDGYHFLKMLMQSIDLCDVVTLTTGTSQGIEVFCDREGIPKDSSNIAWKAAQAFYHAADLSDGVQIEIEKNIPFQAGLGGGSADGAAVLVGLNEAYQTGFSVDQLCRIGIQIGADLPFCIRGGTMQVEGIGEICTPIPNLSDGYFVLAKPKEGISTREAYRIFDGYQGEICRPDMDGMIASLVTEDLEGVAAHMGNVLQQCCPLDSVHQLTCRMKDLGALGAVMTGSGSTVVGLFDTKRKAKRAYSKLKGSQAESVFLAQPVPFGAKIQEG